VSVLGEERDFVAAGSFMALETTTRPIAWRRSNLTACSGAKSTELTERNLRLAVRAEREGGSEARRCLDAVAAAEAATIP
jgi:hypothetical protein